MVLWSLSRFFEVTPLVTSPWPLVRLDLPCFHWLSWKICGGEGCTVQRARSVPFPCRHKSVRSRHQVGHSSRITARNFARFPHRHTEAVVQTRVARWEQEKQRLDLITGDCHVGVVSWCLHAQDVETKKLSIELVTGTVKQEGTAPGNVASPEEQFIHELVRREIPRGAAARAHGPPWLASSPTAGGNEVALATGVLSGMVPLR